MDSCGTRVPDKALAAMLEGSIFAGRIYRFATIDSTNSGLLAASMKDASGELLPEGTVYVADEQRAGRGRGGHSWHSAAGVGLYLSALLRPHLPPDETLGITLAAGIAAAQAISEVANVDCDIRWPNDLLLQEKKIGGILTEMASGNDGAVVVGFGINVNHASMPSQLEQTATSLFLTTGSRHEVTVLAASLLQFFDREYLRLRSEGLGALLIRFEERSSYVRGKHVAVGENGGYLGVTDGLDHRGFLRVRTAEGLRTVLSGTVRGT